MALNLVVGVIVYVVFFRWNKTAVSGPQYKTKHARSIGIALIVLGFFGLVGMFSIMGSGALEIFGPMLWIAVGVVYLIVAVGLLWQTQWAPTAATALAFFLFQGSILMVATGLYIWWTFSPAGRKAPEIAQVKTDPTF